MQNRQSVRYKKKKRLWAKRYRLNNKERISFLRKKRYLEIKSTPKYIKLQKNWKEKWQREKDNPIKKQKHKEWNRLYYLKLKKTRHWELYLHYAKSRCRREYKQYNIQCNLTKDQIKKLWFRDKAYTLQEPNLDRIKSKGNYTYSNCRFIEATENSQRVFDYICPNCGHRGNIRKERR